MKRQRSSFVLRFSRNFSIRLRVIRFWYKLSQPTHPYTQLHGLDKKKL